MARARTWRSTPSPFRAGSKRPSASWGRPSSSSSCPIARRRADVVLGFDRVESYAEPGHYLGCVVGRVANRIALGRFTLDGREHRSRSTTAAIICTAGPSGSRARSGARSRSPRRERRAFACATGRRTARTAIRARSTRRSTTRSRRPRRSVARRAAHGVLAPPPIARRSSTCRSTRTGTSPARRALRTDSGDVLDHRLEIAASRYTPADAELIPTGRIAPVAGTDSTSPARAASTRRQAAATTSTSCSSNFVLGGEAGTLRRAATLAHPRSGRAMEVWTTEPGVQLYTGIHLAAIRGKSGATYDRHAGLCLETQHFPDSIHHEGESGWPSIVLRPGEIYRHSPSTGSRSSDARRARGGTVALHCEVGAADCVMTRYDARRLAGRVDPRVNP